MKRKLPTVTFTTWEEFCKIKKIDPKKSLPNVKALDEATARRTIADHKLAAMILHCNGGKLPDYTDGEWKYEPWFKVVKDKKKPSGLGLSYYGYDYRGTITIVGPRFAFYDRDHLMHMVANFMAEYEAKLL